MWFFYELKKRVNKHILSGFLLSLGDVVCLLVSLPIGIVVGHILRQLLTSFGPLPADIGIWDFRAFSFTTVGMVLVLWFWLVKGHYNYRRSFWQELGDVWGGTLVAALLEASLLYSGQKYYSRLTWGAGWVGVALFVPFSRFLIKSILARLGLWQKPTLIVGTGPNAREAHDAILSESLLGYDVKGFVQSETGEGSPPSLLPCPVFPSLSSAFRTFGVGHSRWHLVVALESHEMSDHPEVINRLSSMDADLTIAPPLRGLPLYGMETTHFFSHSEGQ